MVVNSRTVNKDMGLDRGVPLRRTHGHRPGISVTSMSIDRTVPANGQPPRVMKPRVPKL